MQTRRRAESITRPRDECSPRRLLVSRIGLALAIALLIASGRGRAADPNWLPAASNDVEWSVADDTITVRTTGVDPFLVWHWNDPLDPDRQVLEFEYFCTAAIDRLDGFLGPPFTEAGRMELPEWMIAEGWQTYTADLGQAGRDGPAGNGIPLHARALRIDFGSRPDVRLQLRHVRLRPRTEEERSRLARAAEARSQKLAAEQSIADYLRSDFAATIDEVVVDPQSVTVAGSVAADRGAIGLVEYPPHIAISGQGIALQDSLPRSGDRFRVRLARHVDGRDRLHSGWRIRSGEVGSGHAEWLSARHYCTAIQPDSIATGNRDWAGPAVRPQSPKGLSNLSRRGPLEDIVQLGIHAVTINLVLNSFVSTSPGPGKQAIDVPGAAVYFDPQAFAGYDPLIEFARRHKIVVTAIVLIPRASHAPLQSPLVHPETDGGVYAMPDLTTDRGARIYAHVLDRIAARYRGSAEAPAGISNWIAHNEIDFHPVWTNMGRQPRGVLTETYYRSMRMIHHAALAADPHARAFASLTHHWVVPDDGQWKQLAPREVLETLDRYSELEGDFAWGVAYHPYPQNLFAAVAWNDTQVRDDFDTPLITMQNLQVLGRFLEQPGMRDRSGAARPVLLSEQGFHTDSYDPEAQARQAGSLWYAWQKLRDLPWVESFHYHRWIDHPDEGGLMLGLRTLPTAEHPYGQPKRSWHVYQAIGTANESSAVAGLPQP